MHCRSANRPSVPATPKVAGLLIGLVGVSPKRALAIEEQALGANHLIVASTHQGGYGEAEGLYTRRGAVP
jgi:hypothetical protein